MPTSDSSPNGGAPLSRATDAPDREREGPTRAESVSALQPATPTRRRDHATTHQFGKLAEVALPSGSGTPGAARMVVAHCLTGLVSQQILRDAQLLVSEVVTNSLRHGELSAGDTVLVSVYLAADSVRLEIVNAGTVGAVTATPPDRLPRGDGFGLDLVDRLTASWGVRRNGGTNVWFEMGRA
jgi:anti-sigma regulatory factor (Ser/Thr protein kinase)